MEFRELAKHQADLKNIGDISAGIEWFEKNSKDLKLVRNTVFTRSDKDAFTLKYGELEVAILAALESGCAWKDLYASSEREIVATFASNLNARQKSNYSASELDSDLPLMQMMLLTFNNGNVAVLFGWSHNGGKEIDSQVFLSQNHQVFVFFDRYFDMLAARSQKVIVPSPKPATRGAERSRGWFGPRI